MTAVFLSPLYILANAYLLWRLLGWLGACRKYFHKKRARVPVILLYLFFSLAILAGFLLPAGKPQRFFKLIGNYWLGVLLYALPLVLLANLGGLIFRIRAKKAGRTFKNPRIFRVTGAVCVLLVLCVTLYGAANARIIRTTPYEITVNKDGGNLDSLNVVLAADLHLGYNIGCRHMERMVKQINAQNPDLVVFAGDIFDNQYEALDNPDRLISILQDIESTYGVYACYGNHDIEEAILAGFTFSGNGEKKESAPEMDAFLEAAGITLLQDEAVLIDDSFYLYGRPDMAKPGRGIDVRKTPEEITAGLDLTKPILVLDHEPAQLSELEEAGADVVLGGHTHDGQVFPVNLITNLIWENSYGCLRKGDMYSIVTSGVGLFGPNMRVGTIAEICPITIHFQANAS